MANTAILRGRARLQPWLALGTTLGLVSDALETSPLVCAAYPSLIVLMLLVLVAEIQRLLDGMPVAHEEDHDPPEPTTLGFGPCDGHTGPVGGLVDEGPLVEDQPG